MKNTFVTFGLGFLLTGCSYILPPNIGDKKEGETAQENEKAQPSFESIQKLIIAPKCVSCHQPGGKGEDIPLQTLEQILSGKISSGPLLVPGHPEESPLYLVMSEDPAIRGDLQQMPSLKAIQAGAKPVTAEEMEIVAQWIREMNQPAPAPEPVEPVPTEPSPVEPTPTPPEPQPIPSPAPVVINFEQIRAEILDKKCATCHQPGGRAEDYPFQTREEVLEAVNQNNRPFVSPQNPGESLLYLSLLPNEADRKGARLMPPKKAVDSGQVPAIVPSDILLIQKWIEGGAL